jgi:hypothetical protein
MDALAKLAELMVAPAIAESNLKSVEIKIFLI